MSKELGKTLPEILGEQTPPKKMFNVPPTGSDIMRSLEAIAEQEYYHYINNARPFSCIPWISNELKAINKRNEACF